MATSKPAQIYAYEYSVTVNATIDGETRVMTKVGTVTTPHRWGGHAQSYNEVRAWIECLKKAGFKVPPGPCAEIPAEVMILSETKVKMPPSEAQLAAREARSRAGGLARAAKIRAQKAGM
jgi:hypothetical protein